LREKIKERISFMMFMISECCTNALFQEFESCSAKGDNRGGGVRLRRSVNRFVGTGNMGMISSVLDPPISTLR
jgi:hypothetical protein